MPCTRHSTHTRCRFERELTFNRLQPNRGSIKRVSPESIHILSARITLDGPNNLADSEPRLDARFVCRGRAGKFRIRREPHLARYFCHFSEVETENAS